MASEYPHKFLNGGVSPEDEADGWKSSDWSTNGPDGIEAWRVQFDRKVEDLDYKALDAETWNKDLGTYDMMKVIMVIRRTNPDIKVERWRHMPLPIYVQSLNLAPKIFEIEDAMSLDEAIRVAKRTWFDQFGKLGFAATIVKARLATKKDFRKMQELREMEPEQEATDEGGDVQGTEPADEARGGARSGRGEVPQLWLPKQG